MTTGWRFRLVDALDKVLPDAAPPALERRPISAFLGEPIAVQVAMAPPRGIDRARDAIRIEVGGDVPASIRGVELVPCRLVAYEDHDDGYLRDVPGLYPDLLVPSDAGLVEPFVRGWRAAWIELEPTRPGRIEVPIRARHDASGELLFEEVVHLDVLDAELPELDIVDTHWFHADALADAYRLEVFDERHWTAVDRFVASAARMRANSLLVPVWTPPIDTEPGARRRPVQLLDVHVDRSEYRFGFARLDRWLDILRRHGIRHLEVPHLFTQWGAEAAPAIDGIVDGAPAQLFGWHTPATDPEYRGFLAAMLPELRRHLDAVWSGGVVFHVSDEPEARHEAAYRAARSVVADLLEGARVMDALSDLRYVEQGLVERPIAATDAADAFLAAGVPDLWVYSCLTQHRDVANRFIAMPGARQRILGSQVFATGVRGLLHWGFNFYYSARAHRFVDPFTDASAGGTMPAGDPFVVYPGADLQPLESIRHRLAAQGLDDHRALQHARDAIGSDAAVDLVGEPGRAFRAPLADTADVRGMRARLHAALRGVAPN